MSGRDLFDGHRTVFALRVDEDYIYPRETLKVHEVACRHGVRISWYINLEQGHHYPDIIRMLAQHHDVQSHGWDHQTYDDPAKSLANIRKAKEFLEGLGARNEGYVPPFGLCSEADIASARALGLSYVSQFAVASANFPHEVGSSGVMDVPCHPVSLGVLLDLGYGPRNAIRYYERVIDQLYGLRLPIFLYCHSNNRLGKHPEVLEAIFARIDSINRRAQRKADRVWVTTLGEYCAHWKRNRLRAPPRQVMNVSIAVQDMRTPRKVLARKMRTLWFLAREGFRMRLYDYEKGTVARVREQSHGKGGKGKGRAT